MSNGPSDFVQVQLSAAGLAFAGAGGQVRIANGHFCYIFTPGKPVRVLASEWRRVLSIKLFNGQPIFEIAPAILSTPTAPAAPVKAGSQRAARVISPAISHTDAPAQPVFQATQPAANAADPEVK
jgi:hypothetical protein